MNKISYQGPLKEHIINHVELKRAVGYQYNTEAHHLKRFDRFTLKKYPHTTALTKEIVLDWCSKKIYEADANRSSRASVIRQFGIYLDSIGVEAYILPKRHYPKGKQYIPYIYSVDELARFFAETDKCKYCCECPYRHLIMPVFFRMLYMCGLRVSEVRLLTVRDVDIKNGLLTIHHSKNDNSRLVPMSGQLTELCRYYSERVHPFAKQEDFYFPAFNEKVMTIGNVYKNFRRFLWRAKISHGGRGCGPRVHDFRHSYAVHCLKKWAEQKIDLTVYLPLLKTYMGHDSFEDTAYYLRLTADIYPHITLKLDTMYSDIIPVLKGGSDEAY